MLTASPETIPYGSTLPIGGTYAARLMAVRRFETTFGWRVGFEFELLEGQPGARVIDSAADSPSPRGKLAEMIDTLTGRPATAAELGGDLHDLIGRRCHARVSLAVNRAGKAYLRVDRLFP